MAKEKKATPFFYYALNNHLIWKSKLHEYIYIYIYSLIIHFLWMSTDRAEKLQSPRKYQLLDITYLINKSQTFEVHYLGLSSAGEERVISNFLVLQRWLSQRAFPEKCRCNHSFSL